MRGGVVDSTFKKYDVYLLDTYNITKVKLMESCSKDPGSNPGPSTSYLLIKLILKILWEKVKVY